MNKGTDIRQEVSEIFDILREYAEKQASAAREFTEKMGNLAVILARLEVAVEEINKSRCSAPNLCLRLEEDLKPIKQFYHERLGERRFGRIVWGLLVALAGGTIAGVWDHFWH